MITQENIHNWIKEESSLDLLQNLDSHLGHGRIMTKDEIEQLIYLFPQFIYEGKGFRIILSDGDNRYNLEWTDTEANISWSTDSNFIEKFIEEYLGIRKTNNLYYKVYSAEIRGFDVTKFSQFLKSEKIAKEIYSILQTHGHEQEILVCEYSNLKFEYDADTQDS